MPYAQITAFWRYWIYYLNPWTYILGGETFFAMRNIPVTCSESEYARFPPPSGQTCGQYLEPYLAQAPGYVLDPSSTTECAYCQYSNGNDYLANVNLDGKEIGGRNIGITIIYCVAFFALVFFMMWRRSRPGKNNK